MDDWKDQRLTEAFDRFRSEVTAIMADSHVKGQSWQEECGAAAKELGLHVEKGKGREDLRVNGLKVQCKNIDKIERGGLVSIENMRSVKANNGHRGYLVGEYDVMALKHRGTVYLIPAERLSNGGKLANRICPARFADCINQWSVFDRDYQPPEPPQRPLFG